MYPRMNARKKTTLRIELGTCSSTDLLTGNNAENAATETTEQVRGSIGQNTGEGLLLIRGELVVDNATDLGQFSKMSSHCVLLAWKGIQNHQLLLFKNYIIHHKRGQKIGTDRDN